MENQIQQPDVLNTYVIQAESIGTIINIESYEPALYRISDKLRRVNHAIRSHSSANECAKIANEEGLIMRLEQDPKDPHRRYRAGLNPIEDSTYIYMTSNCIYDIRWINSTDIEFIRYIIDINFPELAKLWAESDKKKETA